MHTSMTKDRATVADLMGALWHYVVLALAYGFGTGQIPYASGTPGSLIGVVLFWAMASPLQSHLQCRRSRSSRVVKWPDQKYARTEIVLMR